MRNPADTLEEINKMLDELKFREEDVAILVEGQKDVEALNALGIDGDLRQVQSGKSIFQLAEELARDEKEAIILTDWDRTGGQLCRLLKDALKANEVSFDHSIRTRLARLSKKEIKDVEGLIPFISRLQAEARRY